MVKNEPLVSVIIPVYNVEKYLRACLDSVVNQTYENLEIIIVNDGSTDNSGKICQEYVERDKRIRYFEKKNGGLSSARNFGLDRMSGNYVVFLDSDDIFDGRFVELLYNAVDKKEVGFSFCRFKRFREEPRRIKKYKFNPKDIDKREYLLDVFYQHDQSLFTVAVWNKCFGAKIFDGLRFKEGVINEDLEITDKIVDRAGRITCIDLPLYQYRITPNSITESARSEDNFDSIKHINGLSEKYKNDVGVVDALRVMKYTRCIELLTKKYDAGRKISKEDEAWNFIKKDRGAIFKNKFVRTSVRISSLLTHFGRRFFLEINSLRKDFYILKNNPDFINFFGLLFYICFYSIITIFFEPCENIFPLRHVALFIPFLISVFCFFRKFGPFFWKSPEIIGRKVPFAICGTGLVFLLISIFKAHQVGMSFSARSIILVFDFVVPILYAYNLVNYFSKRDFIFCLKISLWLFVFFYLCQPSHNLIKIINPVVWMREFNIFEWESFTESHIFAEALLYSFLFFEYIYNSSKENKYTLYRNIAYIFTILCFKRLGIMFSTLILIAGKFIQFNKIKKNKFVDFIIPVVICAVVPVYFVFMEGRLFGNVDIDAVTSSRGWILSLWRNHGYFSYGYGTSLYVIGRYLEMDLVQIYLELGIICLWIFCMAYFTLCGRSLYSTTIMIYVMCNMLTASTLPWSIGVTFMGLCVMGIGYYHDKCESCNLKKISIITPFYNGNKYISELSNKIEKILKDNTYLEWIIVDDGASCGAGLDRTKIFENNNVKIIVNEQNLGIHRSRVIGLNECSGEYVIFLDQDDIVNDCMLSDFKEKYNEKTDVFVYNGVDECESFKYPIYRNRLHGWLATRKEMYIKSRNYIISPGQCIIKKDAIPNFWKNHCLKKSGADDYMLWIFMLCNGCKFSFVESIAYTHRKTGENFSENFELMNESEREMLFFLKDKINKRDYAQLYRTIWFRKKYNDSGRKKIMLLKRPLILFCELIGHVNIYRIKDETINNLCKQ